jgi:hypothetical protein
MLGVDQRLTILSENAVVGCEGVVDAKAFVVGARG